MPSEIAIKPWLLPPPKRHLFQNVNVVDVANGTIRPSLDVSMVDGKIAAITPAKERPAAQEGEQQAAGDTSVSLDCTGRYLCPGLIDCHCHLIATPGFNHLSSAFGNPEAVSLLRQPYACAQMLRRGFTAVRDCGGAHAALKEAIEDGVFPGPRLFIAGHALSQSGGHADFRGRHDTSACCGGATTGLGRVSNGIPECMQAVREEIRCGSDFIKIMGSGGVSSPTDKIDHLQFTAAEIRAMVECAANAGTYVTAHAYTAKAIRHCVENGVRGIEHGNFLDEDTAKLMVERGAFLTPTLVTYHEMASPRWAGFLPAESQGKNTEVLHAGLRALKIAADAGVAICYGTDLLGPLGAAQSQEFTIRAEVLSPAQLLRSATIEAARLVGCELSLGQIQEGFEADVLLLDANPLEDATILSDPEGHFLAIMKGGRVYKSQLSQLEEDGHVPVRI